VCFLAFLEEGFPAISVLQVERVAKYTRSTHSARGVFFSAVLKKKAFLAEILLFTMKLNLRSRSKRSSGRKKVEVPAEVAVDPRSPLVKELSATFVVFDRDSDGRISKSELGTVLSSLGDNLSDSELDELMAKVDGDGDGFIDLQEFIDFHTQKSGRTSDASLSSSNSSEWSEEKEMLQAAFDVFDANRDGFISAEELRRVMCSLGDEHISLAECSHMINCVDKDGNQMVDFTEFQDLMTRGIASILC
jgi:calcium-binding protein CML